MNPLPSSSDLPEAGSQTGPRLKIVLGRTRFRRGEPIRVNVSLINDGPGSILLLKSSLLPAHDPLMGSLRYEVMEERGVALEAKNLFSSLKPPQHGMFTETWMRLDPGHSYFSIHQIAGTFACKRNGSTSRVTVWSLGADPTISSSGTYPQQRLGRFRITAVMESPQQPFSLGPIDTQELLKAIRSGAEVFSGTLISNTLNVKITDS